MINLKFYTVREFDIVYDVKLDENDPLVIKFLEDNELSVKDLSNLDFEQSLELWSEIIGDGSVPLEEEILEGNERFVDLEVQ